MATFSWQKIYHLARALAATGVLLSLLVITSGICFGMLMPMSAVETQLSCAPMSADTTIFCPMQFAKMIADGNNFLLGLVENGRTLLSAVAVISVLFVASILWRTREGPERQRLNILLRRNFVLKSFNYLLQAYSAGILQPKLYA